MTRNAFILFAPIALLTACGDPEPVAETATEQGGKATGEVLGGSISDDMIALDQLTSQSPPAEPVATSSADNSSAAPAPASEPAPEPESQRAGPDPAAPALPVAAPLEE